LRAAFAECWRVAFDAVADKYGFTEAMRTAGWQVFRQTEVTGPMYGYGDLAGRICRCSGFWLHPVFGGCKGARCARSKSVVPPKIHGPRAYHSKACNACYVFQVTTLLCMRNASSDDLAREFAASLSLGKQPSCGFPGK